jgi:selenocysteine lyase/cysteine desulfurase
MPGLLPDRLEAGSQNGPGLAGLLAGVRWVLEQDVQTLHAREARLKARLLEGLRVIPGVRIHSPPAPDGVGIITLTVDHLDAATLARRLDQEHGVLGRAGLHCAPGAHMVLGTERAGALRLSLGWATTDAQVDWAADAVRQLCGANVPEPVEVM